MSIAYATAVRHRPLSLIAGLLIAAAPALAIAAPERYEIDPVHTRVAFAIDHAGFSKAIGTVSGSTGEVLFDPQDWNSARVQVSVPLQRLDLGDGKRNEATLARGLLDAQRHPQATFVSTRIETAGEDQARIHGLLTLRGVTRQVTLDAHLNAIKRHPLPPFRRTAGFSATATISRADFGIDAWKSVIGDEVQLRIEVEAVRRAGAAEAAGDAATEAPPAEPASPPDVPEPTP